MVSGSEEVLRRTRRWLARDRWKVCTTRLTDVAVWTIDQGAIDLVILDIAAGGDGLRTILNALRTDPVKLLIPVLLIAHGARQTAWNIRSALEIADVISLPLDPEELRGRVSNLLRQKRRAEERDSVEAVVVSLAATIEAKDPYTQGHSRRLADYATAFATRLGLDSQDTVRLRHGAILHDLGKIGIPDSLLLKPSRLDPHEYAVIKHHPVIGDLLCSQIAGLQGLRPIIRSHHERLDGSGYPDGLRYDAIPLLAQVTAIADVYDALTSDRPYRPAWSPDRAYEELLAEVRRGWRRTDLVQEFIELGSDGGLH